MTRRPVLVLFAVVAAVLRLTAAQAGSDAYLSWSDKQAETVGRQMYQKGRVGGVFDLRLLKTDPHVTGS